VAISISPTPKMSYQIYCCLSTYFPMELPLSPSLFHVNILKTKYMDIAIRKNRFGQLVGVGPGGPLQPTDYIGVEVADIITCDKSVKGGSNISGFH